MDITRRMSTRVLLPPDEVNRLLGEAVESGRHAETARRSAEFYYQERRRAVTQLREAGVSFGVIAKGLGITRSSVQAILR